MLGDPTARCKWNNGAAEDWETKFAALIQIATGTVDDHAGNAVPSRSPAQQAAPARGIGPSAMLDDHDLTRLCRHDGRGTQVPFGQSFDRRSKFHGHNPAGNALPLCGQPDETRDDSAETEFVERV
ncbi:hypothetical protein GCM10019071_34270 [Sphingobium fuliginis]|uniref:Uncharacterized protein n=1 Tax=Sphingobium fuliginis (strain ATCC 27551) TaxID=336203 RepID=A0ABQ1F7D4_SPHSA|nr:hypothetical protein GCM10019071_34270 [Sphingobium fuliginis]